MRDSGIGNFSKHTILTGAGWSHNWGGWLAREIWQELIGDSNVQANDRLRKLLLGQSSFEIALAETLAPPFTPDDRLTLERATMKSFLSMDREIARINHGPWINGVQQFLFRFWGQRGQPVDSGYIFTLNQDLFNERHLYNEHVAGVPGVVLPGTKAIPNHRWFTSTLGPYSNEFVTHPVADDSVVQLVRHMNVIKLHGSFNWRSADGQDVMVIGTEKSRLIPSHALLAWYFDVFRRVLCAGGVRLAVVAYGFGDEHVNAIIADAVENHGLKVLIWNVTQNLQQLILDAPHGPRIWAGILTTATRQMIDVFPRDQAETEEYRRICRALFE